MSNSSVFWKIFMETGGIGSYLLYRYTNGNQSEKHTILNQNDEQDQLEVASERG